MDSEGYGTINRTCKKSVVARDTISDDFETVPLVNPSDHTENCMEPSIWSRLFFKWLTPILIRGNEKQRLDPDDLNLVTLPVDCTTESTTNRFEQCWKQEMEKNPSNPSLVKSLFRAFGIEYVVAGLLQFFHDCCIFVGPQVLRGMINYLSSPVSTHGSSIWVGVALTVAVACSQIAMSLCIRHYFFKCHTTGLRIRTSLIIAVFKKALLLSSGEKQKRSQGEISNLMSIDAERLQDLMTYGHSIWSSPFQIAISLVFLWRELGPSSLGGVAVIIVMIPISGKVSKWMGALQEHVMKATDERAALNSEVLANMKITKFQVWEESFQSRILSLRDFELSKMKRYCIASVLSNSMWIFITLVVSLATFACYVISGHTLDVATALTSLALFDILRFPLFMLSTIINNIVQAMVSIKRVRSFLLCEEYRPVDERTSGSAVKLDNYNATYEHIDRGIGNNEVVEADIQISLLRSRLDDAENELQSIESESSALLKRQKQSSDKETIPNLLCLHRVKFECKQGECIAIVGSVGSGKSSFINAILGEVKQVFGSATVNGSLAYFSQTPFILNASVRDNIIFGHLQEPVDEGLYQRCLDCCSLRHDLDLFPDGDETEIGEKGITLSGGQKARISLARAVYHQGDVTLVDDALSAVDAEVASHLFEKALMGELMEQCASRGTKNRSVVMVTNALQFLSDPRVHRIVVVQDGKIVEEGTYTALAENDSSVFSRMISVLEKNISESDEFGKRDTVIDDDDDTDTNYAELIKEGSKQSPKSLMTEEIREKGHVDISVYLAWANAAGGLFVPVSIVVSYLLYEIFSVLSNWWLTHWSANSGAGKSQFYFLTIYSIITVSEALLDVLGTSIVVFFGFRASRKLFSDMLEVVLHAKMSFFDTTPVGRLVNRFTEDIYTIDEELPETMVTYLFTSFEVLSTIAVIVTITPPFAICLIPIAMFYLQEQAFFKVTYRELKRLDAVAMSPIYAFLNEAIDGTAVIRAFKAQPFLLSRLVSMLDKQQHAYFLTFAAESWLDIRLELIGTFFIVFACLSAVVQHHFFGVNAGFAGLAGLSISYALSVTESLHWMIRTAIELEGSMVAVERVREYTKLENEGARVTKADEALPQNWPLLGEITFKSAKLRYRDGLPLALKGLDLIIPSGSKVGVVGRTGAGKSTLMVALMRIVELCDGQILIDGIDSRTVGLATLRNNIAVIPQDPVLFSGTIRSNVDPFDEYTDDVIINVLDQVGLIKAKSINASTHSALSLGKTRLDSLDDEVNEGGSNFSVGQKQLVVIARALLHGAKIVIMDEATASVDAETDASIQKVLRLEFAISTCITIAHRLNTIMDSDYILVMDDGKAAEFDTPANLIQKRGMFYNLIQAARFD